MSTYGSGIYKMSLSGKILEQHQSDKFRSENWNLDRLCNDWVNCMMEDSDGLLWIGTCNGLSCFNPATRSFINYFSKNNLLPNVFVHTVLYSITMYILSRIRHKQEILRREHLEQINEAKLQFFINISHEIRTPMTLIVSPLEKLLAEHSERQATYLMIYRNAQRIFRLINQLMDIRKLDKGQMHLKFRETDIVGFIDELMQTFEYQAQKSRSCRPDRHSFGCVVCNIPRLPSL